MKCDESTGRAAHKRATDDFDDDATTLQMVVVTHRPTLYSILRDVNGLYCVIAV